MRHVRSESGREPRSAPALLDLEDDLQLLRGIFEVLTIIGDADDSVEPVAISVLARTGGDALQRVLHRWEELRAR